METKNPVGCPLQYKSVEEMQPVIDAYFQEIDTHNIKVISEGNLSLIRPYTITGLAMALKLTRQGLINYLQKKDGEFVDTINEAKSRVERFNEEQLYRTGQVTGVIFNLKNNFGWKDAIDQNIGGQNGENPLQQEFTLKGLLNEISGTSSDL